MPSSLEHLLRHASTPARKILRALLMAQARHTLFVPRQPIIVAVSGGADSICLLHALHQLAPIWELSLHVAHLDHALRPESGEDAAFVATIAQRFSLPYTTSRLTPGTLDDDPEGLEGAARSTRYAFLRHVANNLSNQSDAPENVSLNRQETLPVTVATAHHQDDQAETLLMHLLQGSGLNGLAGMAWVGEFPDSQRPSIRLVRPLLAIDRTAIHDYLHSYGLQWREDRSNQELTHLRNRLRHEVLPLLATINPKIHATLARSADLLAAEAEHASRRDQRVLAELTLNHTPSTRIVLDWFPLTQQELATQRGVLRQALLVLGIDIRTVGMEGIDSLLQQARSVSINFAHPLIAGWTWTLLRSSDATHLSLHRTDALPTLMEHPHLPVPIATPLHLPSVGALKHGGWQLNSELLVPNDLPTDWHSRGQPWRLFCDNDQLCVARSSGELYLTTFRAGMTIAPLGMGGNQRALGDIFTDHKIPPFARPGWPVVVAADGTVLWLCGLVVADSVAVRPTTRQVRYLHWQREREANP